MRKRVGWADLGLSICGGCGDPVPDGQDLCPICEEEQAWAAFAAECLRPTDDDGGDGDDGK